MKSISGFFHLSFIMGVLAASSVYAKDSPAGCRVVPGRNVQVSHSTDSPGSYMMELVIAANPKDGRNLIAGGMYVNADLPGPYQGAHPTHLRWYYTQDGGCRWRESTPQQFMDIDQCGDPAVVFNKDGLAILRGGGNCGAKNWVSTSKDGGQTWQDIDKPWTYFDLEMPVADLSDGKYGGYVYWFGLGHVGYRAVVEDSSMSVGSIGAQADQLNEFTLPLAITADVKTWRLANVIRARDMDILENTTFAFEVDKNYKKYPALIHASSARFIKNVSQLVGRSGELRLVFASSYKDGERIVRGKKFWLTSSQDAAATFSTPAELMREDGKPLLGSGVEFMSYSFGIDNSDGPFSDRLYVAWAEQKNALLKKPEEDWQLLFSSSSDGGKTWRVPTALIERLDNPRNVIARGNTHDGHATLPALHVNNKGIVAVTWYQFRPGRRLPDGAETVDYQRYVTASVDGGSSFLASRPLASKPSLNFIPPSGWSGQEQPKVHGDLGHYLHFTADTYGNFNSVWMDGRSGRQEMWYAPIRVECNGNTEKKID